MPFHSKTAVQSTLSERIPPGTSASSRGGVATAHGATIVPPLAQGPVLSPGLLRVVFSFQEVDENQTFLVCYFFGGRGEKGCNLRT